MAKPDVPTLNSRAKAPKMSVSPAASMRMGRRRDASRRTHARPRLEAATLRVRAVTKVRAYVARLMHRVAAGEAPAAIGTARGSSTATVGEKEAMRACCRTRARRAASRESARRAVERCWADETDSEAEAVPLGGETSDLDALRIARNRLAADVERLRTLAREGDATAARRASSEALTWLSSDPPVMVPSDPWVRDPLHAYTPAARREIACAGALSINDLDASEADDERDPYHPPFLTYIWEAASSRPLPTAFWRGTGAGNTEEVLGAQ